jgi:hypothetical protein
MVDALAMRARVVLGCLAFGLLSGCLLPNRGTPVHVDMRAGEFWSGRGRLLEVSEDQTRCRVAVRHRTGYVQERWVDCRFVHARSASDSAAR